MGGQADHRPAVTPAPDSPEAALAARRARLAMVRLAVGGPTFMVLLFGLVIAYRVAGRPLGDGAFWALLGTLVLGFAAYAGAVLISLRRHGR